VVDVGSIGHHAMRVHGQKVDLEQLSKDINHFQLNLGNASVAQYRIGTIALKDPIVGLEVVDGFGCKLCIFYCHKLSTLKAHLRNTHESSCSAQDSHHACSVQRLSPSPGSNSWFGVIGRMIRGAHNPLMDIIRSEAQERWEEVLVASYNEVRHLPLFIKRLNWDHFICNMSEDIVELAPLVSVPGPGDARFFPGRLREVCTSLMSDFQCNTGTAEALLRRKVKSTKAEDISSNPFSRLEQSSEDYVAL
jgi:hypothetical protein